MAYTERVRFEWDPRKERANQKKHGLSFDQAVELFTGDSDYLEIYDEGHSDTEDRFLAIGPIRSGVVVVVYSEPREDLIRVLSARRATKREVLLLQQYLGGING